MMEETAAGPTASSASHCALKSCNGASAAVSATRGPKRPRNSRTFASCAASRFGGGSGIHKLSCTAPFEDERNSCIQAAIAVGDIKSAPADPIPPALATAIDNEGGQAPAIGASRIGTRNPKRSQNFSARASGDVMGLWLSGSILSGKERASCLTSSAHLSYVPCTRSGTLLGF